MGGGNISGDGGGNISGEREGNTIGEREVDPMLDRDRFPVDDMGDVIIEGELYFGVLIFDVDIGEH